VNEDDVLAYAREEIEKSFERVDVGPYLQQDPGFWQGWRTSPE
jgi:hypothetical protein